MLLWNDETLQPKGQKQWGRNWTKSPDGGVAFNAPRCLFIIGVCVYCFNSSNGCITFLNNKNNYSEIDRLSDNSVPWCLHVVNTWWSGLKLFVFCTIGTFYLFFFCTSSSLVFLDVEENAFLFILRCVYKNVFQHSVFPALCGKDRNVLYKCLMNIKHCSVNFFLISNSISLFFYLEIFGLFWVQDVLKHAQFCLSFWGMWAINGPLTGASQ